MISVIIPARNEEEHLPQLLARLRGMPEVGEIIVADGGSEDNTVQIARDAGAVVIEGARGRGTQQNMAAESARGDILWFLHADALPAPGCGRQIESESAIGGNFRLHFDAHGFWPRLFELIARVQRRLGTYYGDSGLWVRREAWKKLGGFEAWPLFEDLDFAWRLEDLAKLEGRKTACCPGRLHVSARRFEKSPHRVLWLWLRLQFAFEMGRSPEELARLYHGPSNG